MSKDFYSWIFKLFHGHYPHEKLVVTTEQSKKEVEEDGADIKLIEQKPIEENPIAEKEVEDENTILGRKMYDIEGSLCTYNFVAAYEERLAEEGRIFTERKFGPINIRIERKSKQLEHDSLSSFGRFVEISNSKYFATGAYYGKDLYFGLYLIAEFEKEAFKYTEQEILNYISQIEKSLASDPSLLSDILSEQEINVLKFDDWEFRCKEPKEFLNSPYLAKSKWFCNFESELFKYWSAYRLDPRGFILLASPYVPPNKQKFSFPLPPGFEIFPNKESPGWYSAYEIYTHVNGCPFNFVLQIPSSFSDKKQTRESVQNWITEYFKSRRPEWFEDGTVAPFIVV